MSLASDTTMMMPVAPTGMGTNNSNGSNWGGDGAWWLIVLFLFIFAGGWGNGWGNGGGMNAGNGGGNGGFNTPGFQGYATRADINEGFALNNLDSGIRAIQNGISESTYALTNSINNGFSNAELSRCNQQAALMQQLNNMAMTQQNCCCETREAIQGVNYNMATQTNALQSTMNNNTRDIIENANANSRAILDYLCQDKISTLQSENQGLRLAASQQAQNATLQAAMAANTNEILARTAPWPVPSYPVANPYTGGYAACTCAGNC